MRRKLRLADFRGARVVVHTRDDQSIRGILAVVGRDCLLLDGPEWLNQAETVPIPKQAVVPFANYAFMQVLEAGHANV